MSKTFIIDSKPGIKRDGTEFDNDYYQDGTWVRFQRGKPRKIGGYKAISDALTGPVRAAFIDSRAAGNTVHAFSPWGVQQLSFDYNGAGAGIIERTPAGFVRNDNYTWQADTMYQGGGSPLGLLVCAATPDADSIASDTVGAVYQGDVTGSGVLTAVSDGAPIQVSGGCVVLQPFLVVYGSNGLIRNSKENDISAGTGWAGGNAVTANVAGSKIVKGMALRGGAAAPAGLFWALDALIRMTFVGGTKIWQYDTVSDDITVLSKNAMVEYDGVYYWPGVDRFFMYNGVVQEVPNQMNADFFFEGLNFSQRQRVFSMKVPRFGEVWWFFPSGSNTECDKAVILNIREGCWYDAALVRTAGAPAKVFRSPVLFGGEPLATTLLSYTAGAGTFAAGMTVTGGTSGATGVVKRALPGGVNVVSVTGTFVNGEVISSGGNTGTINAAPAAQQLDIAWQHETGYDRIYGSDVTAIESSFETNSFSLTTGGPVESQPVGDDMQVRLTRFEPDFVATGSLELTITGKKFAQSPFSDSAPYTFDSTTEYVDLREQRRQMALRVRSNERGGMYQCGRLVAAIEPGDKRS